MSATEWRGPSNESASLWISAARRPDEREAFEYRGHCLVEGEPFAGGAASEIRHMRRQPVTARAIALTLVPGKGVVDLIQRLHLDRPGSPDRTRPVGGIEHDDMTANTRHHLTALLDIAQQAGRRSFGAFEDQRQQPFSELRAVAHAANIVILLRHTTGTAVRLPERFDLGRTRPVHRATMSEIRQTDNAPAA